MDILKKLSFALSLFAGVTLPAVAAVTVNSPANDADVSSPFALSALALSCSSQPVSAVGYSLDSSTDTTIVLGTSLNAQVPAANGAHTLHVKAWGDKGASCVTDVAITVTAAAPSGSSGGISISSPGSGAEVSTPFTLSATAKSCSSQPVSTMGYSLDSSATTITASGTTLNAKVSASVGAHTLHVKSWGNKGAGCAAAIPITVSGAAAPPSGSGGITVSSPANGSVVGTSFSLVADAATCSSQPVTAMGYSLDSSSDTTVVDKASVGATITTTAGAHTLHVKSWGNGGAGCDTDIDITAKGTGATTASSGIVITSPANAAEVSTSFTLEASATACSSQPVSAMGYSLDGSSDTITFNGTTLNASVSTSAGAHTVHVKSWGDKGSACAAEISVTAAGTGASPPSVSSVIPSDAVSVGSIQTLDGWRAVNDTGANGSSTGSMSVVGSPSLSGHAREFVTHYSNAGDERFAVSFGDDTQSTNFFYDAYVYFTSSSSDISNLEMDMNQTMPNGQTATFGFQCDGYSSTWDYTKNAGSPQKPVDKWVHSGAHCNPRSWAIKTWHHVQVYYSRTGSGVVTYHSVWLDGTKQDINATVPSAFALGWAPSLLTNFEVDGVGKSGSSTVYVDKLTVYRW